MTKCPKCGAEVAGPRKRWTMAGRPDKSGKRVQLEIGIFDCPSCGIPFRVVLSKQRLPKIPKLRLEPKPKEKEEKRIKVSKTLVLKERLFSEEIDHILKSLKKETK